MAKINLFLGHKCNFNCSYCLQSFKDDDYLHQDDVDINKLVDQLSIEAKERTINKIAYWGGEPLLYFKTIKRVHDRFLENGIEFNQTRVLTNGSLFTEEIVDYFNRMNIHVGLSIHSGFGTPNWEMIKKLHRWSVIYLYTGNQPDYDIHEKIAEVENIVGREVFPYFHWVRATDNCKEEDYFTEETLEIHKKYLYKLADMRLNGDRIAYNLFEPHIKKMAQKFNQKNWNGCLCINNRILTVDLYGNKFTCHHSPIKENYVGNLFKGEVDLPNTNIEKAKDKQMQFVNTDECKSCDIRSWCRGNCFMSNTHTMDCKLQKLRYEVFSYIIFNEHNRNQQ